MLGSRTQGLVRIKDNLPRQAGQLIQQIYIAATHTQQSKANLSLTSDASHSGKTSDTRNFEK
jgi:hypothetical protein